jgi:hypothetical protein
MNHNEMYQSPFPGNDSGIPRLGPPQAGGNDYTQMGNWGQSNQPMDMGMAGFGENGLNVGNAAPTSMPSWSQRAFGGTDENGMKTGGFAMPAIQAVSGVANSYLGLKQYGLAKQSLKENKRQFNMNYGNQVKMTNTQMRDRQRARVASNPDSYQSVDDYMKQNQVG